MSRYQKLFDYFYQEHNIILLEQEMQEVINFVNEMQERDRIAGELSGSGGICERCKKLEFMIDNGLGWKDMENDNSPTK